MLINSNRNSDLQVAVEVAVAGAHTREIWSRLPLEIAAAIEDRCRGWGPLYIHTTTLSILKLESSGLSHSVPK